MKPIRVLAGVAVLLVFVAAGWIFFNKASQSEPEPAASTKTLISPSVSAPLCDAEEKPCMEIHFDGTNCTVAGPTDTHTGTFAFVYVNDSEEDTRFEVVRIGEDKGIEDLAYFAEFSPQNMMQSWMHPIGFWNSMVISGKTVSLEAPLMEPGEYGVLCYKDPPYAYFGGGFTLEGD